MAKYDVVITLVVESVEDRREVGQWCRALLDTQGDDQMNIKKRSVKVTKYKSRGQRIEAWADSLGR